MARISKLLGNKSKLVVTIHSTAGYSKTQESILGKYTDVYTVVSKDTLQYSKNQLGITQKVHLIDNGINLQVYSNIHKENIPFEILSVGRVQSEKDYVKAAHFLAPFLKKHREVKWLIYGDYTSDTNYYCTLIKEIKKIGIENHVEFKGVSTTPKDIYKHGNVFVLASVYEGFGNAFIEAIMSEHFIFSRNVGVIQDILKDGGIIHSLDDEKSIEFLEDIYAKRAFETELEINKHFETELEINKQIVSNRFSLESMVEKYFEIYTEVSE